MQNQNQKTNSRAPAFQFYPDKWQSHTRRLSDSAYRVYHELLCWMWQSSEDYCSVHNSPEAIAFAVALPQQCVKDALAEIQNAFAPLLKEENGRLVSNGLRKARNAQLEKSQKARENANARWNHADALKKDADAMRTHVSSIAETSIPQCSPSPSPSPIIKERESSLAESPSLAEVEAEASMRGIPPEVAKAFFDYNEGNQLWQNRHGKAVLWRHKLKTWAETARANKNAPTGNVERNQPGWAKVKAIETELEKLGSEMPSATVFIGGVKFLVRSPDGRFTPEVKARRLELLEKKSKLESEMA